MSQAFTESVVENAALAWLRGLGWLAGDGPAIAGAEADADRLAGRRASDAAGRALICARITNLLGYM